MIKGDAAELKQVILNMVLNAFDALQGPGDVFVETMICPQSCSAAINIRDTGMGIPPANMDKLFVPFFTTKPTGQGIGIGLAICYSIIKNHGGEIDVSSRENHGSTFSIRLPLLESTEL